MIPLILNIVAAAATLVTGVLAVARPQAITGFTGLQAEGGRGLTEIRMAVVRVLSMGLDRSAESSNIVSAMTEVVLGLILAL